MSAVTSPNRSNYNAIFNGEDKETTECEVKGSIPLWLNGHVLRNGPGQFDFGKGSFKHWFDGHALLHRFDIADGKVTYKSRFIRSEQYKINNKYNRIVVGSFGTSSIPDPCKTFFSRFFSKFVSSPEFDECNVNIANLGNAFYAITDDRVAYRFDEESLESKNVYKFNELFGLNLSTAHPHYDRNGDYYNLGSSFGRTGYYGVFKVPGDSMKKSDPLMDLELHTKIPIGPDKLKPSYYHSFGMSENYIILHDQTVRFNAWKMMKLSFTWDGVIHGFEHDTKRESIFHVVDKNKQEKLPIKFASKGRFCFHHINAFEESKDGKKFLVVDMFCSDDATIFSFWLHILRDNPSARKDRPRMWPYRFVLPLDVSSDTPTGQNLVDLDDCEATAVKREDGSIFLTPDMLVNKEEISSKFGCVGLELPSVNYEDYNQRNYRFMYCVGEESLLPSQLLKVDVKNKIAIMWKEEGRFTSEPIFVKKPDSTEEDDGVVLATVVGDSPEDGAYLLILDAKTFQEIARAEVMTKLPYPLHGRFTPRI